MNYPSGSATVVECSVTVVSNIWGIKFMQDYIYLATEIYFTEQKNMKNFNNI
jgi:hypothetical protein